jgi:NAD(P)-dependent dehydrogenase (short-subunit alcohol dehydrogenase family)
VLGVTEAIDEKDLRALMETNFWAALHLTREVVKIFRENNPGSGSIGGVIVQVSSMGRRSSFPRRFHLSHLVNPGRCEIKADTEARKWA